MSDILMASAAAANAEVQAANAEANVSKDVEQALDSPFNNEGMPEEGIAAVEVNPGEEVHHEDPAALGMTATAWVSLAMLAFLAILVWKKVPGLITKSLDDKIAAIKAQLAEAETLRAEAEALRESYAKKLAGADEEAAEIRAAAEREASMLVEKTNADTEALITRRRKMAEEKIAAAERQAVDDLRARTAAAASLAAQAIIAEKHDASSDSKLVDKAIKDLAKLH